ncbi:peptidoglycan DD-metalloendopeptidase family protein [Thioalkalivibrio sulfidiphilus]|uniref:peptidoglycan DD-metalloendopeptidase family protein n=1 Tax=Thioalkalivibrio sulfidiphilus TaxID=1033854 RepID=UPI000363C974|nr:peptidoglycan DD-metalloendopeptidase family protein [Thioalkalivibrio sulfidiphilus]
MRPARLILLVLISLTLLEGCATPHSSDTRFQSGYYTVRPNDTLYSIAWRYRVDWQQLASWNGIRAPYTIHPGQRLRMNPPPGGTATAAAPAPPPASPPPAAPRTGGTTGGATATAPRTGGATASTPPRQAPAAAAPRPAQPQTPPPTAAATGIRWQWPTEGQVIRPFPTNDDTVKRGIGIAGTRGQPVRAAAPGRVVYSGSGLVGYGQLIIVKHDENFLSAYAHNEKLLVNEGMDVTGGQQIARLGDTGTDRPMLHFEIRFEGRPVDPLRYLPRR